MPSWRGRLSLVSVSVPAAGSMPLGPPKQMHGSRSAWRRSWPRGRREWRIEVFLSLLIFFSCFLVGRPLQEQPKAPRFQIGWRWNLAGWQGCASTQRLTESNFRCDVTLWRQWPRRYFMQKSAATWWVKTKCLLGTYAVPYKLSWVELLTKLHLRATGCPLPYGITQCYLSHDTSEHTSP